MSDPIKAYLVDEQTAKEVLSDDGDSSGYDGGPLTRHVVRDYADASDRHKPASLTDENGEVDRDVAEMRPPQPGEDRAEILSQRARAVEEHGEGDGTDD